MQPNNDKENFKEKFEIEKSLNKILKNIPIDVL